MRLSDIAIYVEESIRSCDITLEEYVTTDSLLQNREGRKIASNLPPTPCNLVKYEKDDILIANIRPYLRKIWLADSSGGCSNDVLVFRAKNNISPYYLYATLLQDTFFDYVMLAPKGSKMPRGDQEHIMRFPINQLGIEKERKVGTFIKTINDQLDNLRKQNELLERLSKSMFDYWFVQFDFPNENNKPYKSTGGMMYYNNELKREIPVGWECVPLINIANITMGQSPDGTSYNTCGNGSIFYQGSTDFGLRSPKVRQFTTSPSRFAKRGDILMSVRAPVGATNIASHDCCIGRGLAALNSKLGSMTHLYELISYFRVQFERKDADGTTFGSITKPELFNLPSLKPKQDVLDLFEKQCGPIFNKLLLLGDRMEELEKLRSYMLPLVITGQVSLK